MKAKFLCEFSVALFGKSALGRLKSYLEHLFLPRACQFVAVAFYRRLRVAQVVSHFGHLDLSGFSSAQSRYVERLAGRS